MFGAYRDGFTETFEHIYLLAETSARAVAPYRGFTLKWDDCFIEDMTDEQIWFTFGSGRQQVRVVVDRHTLEVRV